VTIAFFARGADLRFGFFSATRGCLSLVIRAADFATASFFFARLLRGFGLLLAPDAVLCWASARSRGRR
jgi:hypothetical protein